MRGGEYASSVLGSSKICLRGSAIERLPKKSDYFDNPPLRIAVFGNDS